MDIMGVLGYEYLTGLVQAFEFTEPVFSTNVPGREMDGDIAKWRVQKPRINIHDYFTSREGVAQPIELGDWYEKTFQMPYRFTSKTFDAGVLNQLQQATSVGDQAYDSTLGQVDSEVRQKELQVGQMTDDYLVSQAIQGTITIKMGDTAASINETMNYEVPTLNQFSNEIAWTSASTAKPIRDYQKVQDLAGRYGARVSMAVMNGVTKNLLMDTTQINQYTQRYTAGANFLETGEVPPISGIRSMQVDKRYANVNQTEAFENKMIPDKKVIFLPEWPAAPGDWIEMQQGNFYVPNDLQNGFNRSAGGSATWARTTDSPTGLTVFHKVARFPVIRKPWCIFILTIT